MSMRVRFQERPGVTYVPTTSATSSDFLNAIFANPMPPLHREDNFEIDIFTAASIGDVAIVQERLQRGGVSSTNRSGWTALQYASYLGHLPVCTALLDAGYQVDEANKRGQTALMFAAACGNISVVRLLLQRGASTNRTDENGRQPLHYAAQCSQNVVVDSLLAAGGDPNAQDLQLMTPVLEACSSGHELTLLSLLEKGGDPFATNARGENGAALAAESPKIVTIIKEHRPQPQFNHQASTVSCKSTTSNQTLQSIDSLLEAMNLGRLADKFKRENIDLDLFFSLSEKDFDDMGIAYGPKKRMLTVIERYRKTGCITTEHVENLAQPPPYAAAVATTNRSASVDPLETLRYIRISNDATKQAALQALEEITGLANGNRLRSLLTSIIDESENVTSRISRHDL